MSSLPPGAMRAILLAELARRAAHGYALARAIEERTGGALAPKEGTLYPALHELELEALVEARWEKSREGRRRRVYRITPKGRRAAAGWRRHWAAVGRLLADVLGPSPRPSPKSRPL